MYVIVAYDLPVNERGPAFTILNQRLNHIQGSVFSGEMSKPEARELEKDLHRIMKDGACMMWVLDRRADPILIGSQIDKETNIL